MAAIEDTKIPDKEIATIFQFHNSLTTEESIDLFNIVINKISNWLDSTHVSVFTLEKNIKNQYGNNFDEFNTQPFEEAMLLMDPVIQSLPELSDLVEQKVNEQQQKEYMKKITKLQSEWSSLQHFLNSVKKLLFNQKESKKLLNIIEQLIFHIDDISIMIFDFQEKKYHAFALPTSSSLSESSSTDNTTIVSHVTDDFNKEDLMMHDIDHSYEPVLRQMEFLYQKLTTVNDPLILSRFQKLNEKWEALQSERDELKLEQKEDRWLTVFKRVADQVDVMIDGLDRSVVHCYSLIQHIKNPISTSSKSNTSSFSSIKKLNNTVDREKFKTVEKSFEAKYKYYTPSIDRMLNMLGNGISARAAKDNHTSQRHEAMLQRWYHLKEVMNELRMKDLVEADRILFSGRNRITSSHFSEHTASSLPDIPQGWKNPRYRTPEPTLHHHHQQKIDRVRSITPNSGRRNSTARAYPNQPSENISDSLSSTSTIKVIKSPKPTKSNMKDDPNDFYDQDEKDFGLDISNLTQTRERPKDPQILRAKSTIGYLHKRENPSLATNRRSVTPSLIPRPKTPSKNQPPPKQISRPKSYQQPRTNSRLSMTPPVPPIPRHIQQRQPKESSNETLIYTPDPKDSLDLEVAKIINSSPIQIQCQKASTGRYYFGSESSISINGGKKMYACKLMTYNDRKRKGNGQNKVLIRVGGGWQDLDFFLLEHSSFMASHDVPPPSTKKKFASSLLNYWKN